MSCVRPGCSGPAAASFLIDRDAQRVEIHSPKGGGPGSLTLCATHMARFTAPSGWVVHDRRGADDVAAAPAAESPRPVRASRATPADADTGLRVDDHLTPLLSTNGVR